MRISDWSSDVCSSDLLPDKDGNKADVALGYDNLQQYLDKPQYFGGTVGRFANRIAKGQFTLDGKAYQVPVNDGPNSLHGGTQGFDKVLRSEEHTSELQSLMRISYAVLCLTQNTSSHPSCTDTTNLRPRTAHPV